MEALMVSQIRVPDFAPPSCLHLPDPGDARCVARLRRPGREHRWVSSFFDGGRKLIRRCHQGSLHAGAHRWRMRRHCGRRRSIPARHSAHKNAGASARAHGQLERGRRAADGPHMRDHIVRGEIPIRQCDMRQIAAQRQRSGGGLVDRALQSDDTFGEGVTGRGSHAVCKIRL